MKSAAAMVLNETAKDDALIEIGRKAIEDVLVEWRDSRLSIHGRGNGLVIREKDGSRSDMIRMTPETAVKIALGAIVKHIENEATR